MRKWKVESSLLRGFSSCIASLVQLTASAYKPCLAYSLRSLPILQSSCFIQPAHKDSAGRVLLCFLWKPAHCSTDAWARCISNWKLGLQAEAGYLIWPFCSGSFLCKTEMIRLCFHCCVSLDLGGKFCRLLEVQRDLEQKGLILLGF